MNLIKECFKYFQSIVYLNNVTYLFILVIVLIMRKIYSDYRKILMYEDLHKIYGQSAM